MSYIPTELRAIHNAFAPGNRNKGLKKKGRSEFYKERKGKKEKKRI